MPKSLDANKCAPIQQKKTLYSRFLFAMRRDWQLYLFLLLPMTYIIIFKYVPMVGLQIAFRRFTAKGGVWGSEWVWFENFIRFFESPYFTRTISNTFILSVYNLVINSIVPVIFALIINSIEKPRFKKITQTIVTLPHFISTVVLIGLMMQIFNSRVGLYGIIYEKLNGEYPQDIFSVAESFRHMYVLSGTWQSFGWSAIIYIATLSGVDAGLHEAAQIDGASRFQRILHVDLPHILPTFIILTIMSIGRIMSLGYEKALLMQNSLNLEYSELISTYVYRVGLSGQMRTDFSYATAIDLFNSVINLVLIYVANKASKKTTETSLW